MKQKKTLKLRILHISKKQLFAFVFIQYRGLTALHHESTPSKKTTEEMFKDKC